MDRLTAYLLDRIQQVRDSLNLGPLPEQEGALRFKDLLDSMGMVEFLLCVAEECGRTPEQIEACVERRFDTVDELARAMFAADIIPKESTPVQPVAPSALAT